MERARACLQAWQDGDLSALEVLLAPDVTLLWWEPGDWDCHGRDDVLRLLAERRREGAAHAAVELIDAGDDVLVSVSDRPGEPATVIRFRDGKAIEMRQFRTREEALAAAVGRPERRVRVMGYEPCFTVADVKRAVAHYKLLGFTISYHDEWYAFAHRDNLTIHLAHSADQVPVSTLYIHVDDADRLAEDWRAAGMVVEGPADYDYGKREGRHVDPDGNVLRFGSPLRRD